MATEWTCETCVFQTRGRCTLTAVLRDSDGQCLHWGPQAPTNTQSSGSGDLTEEHVGRHLRSGLTHGRLDAMDRDYPPVEELPIDPQDTLSMALNQRVAELEAEVNGLYVDLGAAQDAAHNQQLILGEQMTALAVERRAVEKLATKLGADCTCPDTMVCMERIDECMDTSSDKECTACWAAWAQEQAREEGGE
jgi:hypothetical protein